MIEKDIKEKLYKFYKNNNYKEALDIISENNLEFDIDRYCDECGSKLDKSLVDVKAKFNDSIDTHIGPFNAFVCPECEYKLISSNEAKKINKWLNTSRIDYKDIVEVDLKYMGS